MSFVIRQCHHLTRHCVKRTVVRSFSSIKQSNQQSIIQSNVPTVNQSSNEQQQEQHDQSSNNQYDAQSGPSPTVRLLTWLSLLPIAYAVNEGLATVVRVEGRSMQPTLNPSLPSPIQDQHNNQSVNQSSNSSSKQSNDWVLVWRPNASSTAPRGSIVIVRSAYDAKRLLIKRIVAREGDWLETLKLPSSVKSLNPSFHDYEREFESEFHIIGRGRVWLEGENSALSGEDSCEYGEYPAGLIEGRAVAIVWPPARWQLLPVTLEHVGGEKRIRNAQLTPGSLSKMVPTLIGAPSDR